MKWQNEAKRMRSGLQMHYIYCIILFLMNECCKWSVTSDWHFRCILCPFSDYCDSTVTPNGKIRIHSVSLALKSSLHYFDQTVTNFPVEVLEQISILAHISGIRYNSIRSLITSFDWHVVISNIFQQRATKIRRLKEIQLHINSSRGMCLCVKK